MGGSSTSHSAVLRRENGAHKAYDLRSWQGLTDVLRVAKEKLSPSEHALFRDLVLQYAQRGGDAELKAKIDSVIEGLTAPEKAVETSKVAEATVPTEVEALEVVPVRASVNAMRRSAPRFMPKSFSSEPASLPLSTPPSEIKTEPAPQELEPVAPPVVESIPAPVPTPEPVAPPAVTLVAEEAPTTPRSVEEHKARITEIKRLVNEQIGNPVALLGAHKELGKEYMQALLAALKSTGGGGTGVEAAMRRLEDAYSAVLTDKPKEEKPVTPVVEISKPTAEEPAVIETPKAEPVADVPVPVVLKHESEPVPEVFIPVPQEIMEEENKEIPPAPESEPIPEPAPVVVEEKKQVQTPVSVSRKVPVNFSASATHASLIQQEEKVLPTNPVPPPALPSSETPGFPQTKYTQKKIGAASIQSLAESGIDADETAVRQSELVSPKITQALHELLHEWSIFASSGIFGTGPSGAEHPLYIKIAHLSMGEIITGRYEGADRQVNNVIHDYVNAWRHEQGVAYSPSETFEHFLRRVVQRIQKRTGS